MWYQGTIIVDWNIGCVGVRVCAASQVLNKLMENDILRVLLTKKWYQNGMVMTIFNTYKSVF